MGKFFYFFFCFISDSLSFFFFFFAFTFSPTHSFFCKLSEIFVEQDYFFGADDLMHLKNFTLLSNSQVLAPNLRGINIDLLMNGILLSLSFF